MSIICPVCHHESPDDAKYCFNPACLSSLTPEPEPMPTPVRPAEPRRRARWAWGAGGIGAVALLAGGMASARTVLRNSSGPVAAAAATTTIATAAPTTIATTAVPTTAPAPHPLARDGIATMEATSTLPTQDGVSYGIDNTVDSDDRTAWNSAGSSGARVAPEGQKLTYHFAAPQNVVGIRLRNGFDPENGRSAFTDNYRVHVLTVRGGGKAQQVELQDTFDAQLVDVSIGAVDTVELEITSVYPTKHWKDVGLTEVQFFVG